MIVPIDVFHMLSIIQLTKYSNCHPKHYGRNAFTHYNNSQNWIAYGSDDSRRNRWLLSFWFAGQNPCLCRNVTIHLPVWTAFVVCIFAHGKARLQILALCALHVCLWDPTFSAYLAKKRAEGKHYNVALSHAAKKLVLLIYAMEKSRQPYNSAT